MNNHKTLINIQVQDKIYLDQLMKITLTAHAQSLLSSNGYEHTCISTTILCESSEGIGDSVKMACADPEGGQGVRTTTPWKITKI